MASLIVACALLVEDCKVRVGVTWVDCDMQMLEFVGARLGVLPQHCNATKQGRAYQGLCRYRRVREDIDGHGQDSLECPKNRIQCPKRKEGRDPMTKEIFQKDGKGDLTRSNAQEIRYDAKTQRGT